MSGVGASTARAQLPVGGGGGSSTTTTTTTAAPRRTTTSTTAPQPEVAPADPAAVPADVAARASSVRRTAPNSTDGLLAALGPLGRYGLSETQRALVGFGRFPVAGRARWSDDWWSPRHDPDGTWRVHEGVDIFAPMGTPVRAPVDGNAEITNGGLGGLAVTVKQPDGTYWYLSHLSALAAGLERGGAVKTGQVVAFVGDSGDAQGGAPHLHLEVHPRGGPAVPPKPVIDTFVADAVARVPPLLEAYAQAKGGGVTAESLPAPAIDPLTPTALLLWASTADPGGSALRLAEASAAEAASRIDWASITEADRAARLYLAPLVPRRLALVARLYG